MLAAEKRDYEADQAVCQAFFLKKLESFKTVQLVPLKPELSFLPTEQSTVRLTIQLHKQG